MIDNRSKKKILPVLLACILCVLPVGVVKAAEVYSDGYFYYHACEGYNSICGYFGDDTVVAVPSSIAGRPVSRIEAGAFDGCDTIEKLMLPSTIMEIEDGAFSGAKNLREIEDASGVWKKKEQENPGESVDDGRTGTSSEIDSYEYIEQEGGQQTGEQEETHESGEEEDSHVPAGVENDTVSGEKQEREEKETVGNAPHAFVRLSGIGGIVLALVVILLAGGSVTGILVWRKQHGQ